MKASRLQFKNNQGFTIVELLVVIVVIGVLAGITIVAYNGIRERANDTKRATALDQYVQALQIYKASNGHFLTVDNDRKAACLGSRDLYPASGIFGVGECYIEDGESPITVDDDFNDAIKLTINPLPDGSQTPLVYDSYGIRGALYIGDPVNDKGFILYYDSPKNGLSCPHGTLSFDADTNLNICSIPIE